MIEQAWIDTITHWLARPVKGIKRSRPGVVLSQQTVRVMLEDVSDAYTVAFDEYQMKADPDKPKADAGADAHESHGDWKEFYDKVWHRPRGASGVNKHPLRTGKLAPPASPLTPLHAVYFELRHHWLLAGQNTFYPKLNKDRYSGKDVLEDGEDYHDYWNPEARLLLFVIQELGNYSEKNVTGLIDSMRERSHPST